MLKSHPGEPTDLYNTTSLTGIETVRVPAEDVCQIHDVVSGRPGEYRGLPRLTRTLIKLHDLDRYDDAELVRKKSAAMFAGFYSRPLTGDAEIDKELLGEPDEDGDVIDSPEPGSFIVLPDGYSVNFSNPVDVGGSYEAFMRQQLRAIAQAVGVPYHELTGDHADLNERTIRSILTGFRRQLMAWQQHVLVHQLCVPVWRRFVDMAILSGAWKLPADISIEDAYDVAWVGQAWEHIHPKQDVEALIMARRAGFKSRRQIITQLGGDVEEVDEDIAEDAAREERLGIILDSNPANEFSAPDPRPSEDDEDDDEVDDDDDIDSDDTEELAS
jgi:lambda family phage portal protein